MLIIISLVRHVVNHCLYKKVIPEFDRMKFLIVLNHNPYDGRLHP